MGVLEQVTELKNQGISEEEIVGKLREQGVSPKAINDALGQSRIKSAVSSERMQGMEPSIMRPERAEPLPTEGSLSDADLTPPQSASSIPPAAQKRFGHMTKDVEEEEYVPQPGDTYSQYQYPQQYPQAQYPQAQSYQQEYEPQGYAQGYGYPAEYAGGVESTDTMIEVAEQVFSEKIKAMQKQLEDLNEFKTLAHGRIESMSDRLKRIESNIDRLQSAVLEKVGSYGLGLENVKKELGMMQESFSKVVNTLADKSEHRHIARKEYAPAHHGVKSQPTHSHHKVKTRRKHSGKK